MSGLIIDRSVASDKLASVVIFASGRGSNLRVICESARLGKIPARIEAVVTNVPGSGANEVAREFDIPALEIDSKGKTRETHEAQVLAALGGLDCAKIDWLVLAGYMRLLSPSFIKHFWAESLAAARIVNIHPSLLPSFPGVEGYGQALSYGVKLTGATVHLVGYGLDDGPIIAQRSLEISGDETLEGLQSRGLELEHSLYTEALANLLKGHWQMSRGSRSEGRPRMVFRQENTGK
ncbi:MAG: phosphoribosylglycinamide formyltransferase [Deltaproteobacteria bacterium]|nr:phosphoribosylglycinamide formyltransferase [Deltaproteobacteria bacterium]